MNTANVSNETEIWKEVPDYGGKYFISNLGRVKSIYKGRNDNPRYTPKNFEKILNTYVYTNKVGTQYLNVRLCKNSKATLLYIHRLVAAAFIPNPNGKPQVNHIDGHSLNNSVENLEWVTAKENIRHAWRIGLCTPHGPNKSTLNINTLKTAI